MAQNSKSEKTETPRPRVGSTVLVPILVALVGGFYTVMTTRAQIMASDISSQRELKTRLVEMVSEHLGDNDPTAALSLIDILATVDSDSAARMKARIGQPATERTVSPDAGGVSIPVRCAVRTQMAVAPWPFPGEPSEWYTVLGSFSDRRDAFGKRQAVSQLLGEAARREFPEENPRVMVYLACNGCYVLTLGGRLESGEQARKYAALARSGGHEEFRYAYAWETAPGWIHVPAPAA